MNINPSRLLRSPYTGPMTGPRLAVLAASLAAVLSLAVVATGESLEATAAERANGPLHVGVLSGDFSSPVDGWILGTGPCGSSARCLLLEHTSDGGASWSRVDLPAALRANANFQIKMAYASLAATGGLSVRFANPLDGWISGSMTGKVVSAGVSNGITNLVVWSTHNGGVSWSATTPPELGGASSYFDLEPSAKRVYVLGEVAATGRVIVDSSPLRADHWTRSSLAPMSLPAGGGLPTGALTLSGAHGWLAEGNDRGVTGSAELNSRGQWVTWRAPCASVGYSMAYPQASSPSRLTVACQIGGFGESPVVGGPPGAKLESTWLRISTNGGAPFHWGARIGATYADSAEILATPSSSDLFAAESNAPTSLTASFDGGIHWVRVFHADVVSLTFLTPTFGFGFGFADGYGTAAEAIETVNGGHTWTIIAN